MDSQKIYICKLSIRLCPESYEVLEQKALALKVTVSCLLNCFARDLIGEEYQSEPMVSLANAWFESRLKEEEEDSPSWTPFVQWLFEAGQADLFFCLLDSLYFHIEQLNQSREISGENSRDELCLQYMNDLLMEHFCSSWSKDAGKGPVKLCDFPMEAQIHMRCIFDALRHLYDDYVDREDIDEDDETFGLDLLLAFDFWQERKLRY